MEQTRNSGLNDRVAIVTGAARGLGLGAARQLALEGATVWLADIDPLVERSASELGATGVQCDVSESGEVDDLFERCLGEHGRVDIVVANAGIGGGGPIAEMTDERYRHIIATNLDSVYYTCRAAAREMLPNRSGAIITVGSVFGRDAPAGSSAYGASKAGVVAITQALAKELAPSGIRVNCISPGHMGTELYWTALQRRAVATGRTFEEMVDYERSQVPLDRFGTGEDFGRLVAFLVSDAAAYITGQTINLDGGLQMR
jgi:NAD(P)-dependent dehydrogenase (short-subunit alcohol dehydrogenase family)